MDDDTRRRFWEDLRGFLKDKWHSSGAGGQVVRIHEVGEVGRGVGLDEKEAWRQFKVTEGLLWRGRYLPESLSEERGYTAVRLEWVAVR